MALALQHEQIGESDQSWLMVVALRVGGWQMQLLWEVAMQLYTNHRVLKSWLRGSIFSWTRCRKKNNDALVGYGFTRLGHVLVDELMIPLWPLIQTDNPRESATRHRGGVRVGSSMGRIRQRIHHVFGWNSTGNPIRSVTSHFLRPLSPAKQWGGNPNLGYLGCWKVNIPICCWMCFWVYPILGPKLGRTVAPIK